MSSSRRKGSLGLFSSDRYRKYARDDSEERTHHRKRMDARYRKRNEKHYDEEESGSSSEEEMSGKPKVRLEAPPDNTHRLPSIPSEKVSSVAVPPPTQTTEAVTVPESIPELPHVEPPEEDNVVSVGEVVAAANAVDPRASATSRVRGGGADYFVIHEMLTKQLCAAVAPFVLERMKYIYSKKAHFNAAVFVEKMREIPKWNDLIIRQRAKETLDANPSTLYYFNYSFGARCLLLTNAVKRENDVEFEIPETKFAAYIFSCYIETAKYLIKYPRTMLFCDPSATYEDFKRGRYEREFLGMVESFCSNALQTLIPFKQIMKMNGAPVPREEEAYDEQGDRAYYESSGDEEEDEAPPARRPAVVPGSDDEDEEDDEDDEDEEDEEEDEEDEEEEDEEEEEEEDEDDY